MIEDKRSIGEKVVTGRRTTTKGDEWRRRDDFKKINRSRVSTSNDVIPAFLRQMKGKVVDSEVFFLLIEFFLRSLGVFRVDGGPNGADEVVDSHVVASGNGDDRIELDEGLGDNIGVELVYVVGERFGKIPHLLDDCLKVFRVQVGVDFIKTKKSTAM